MDGGRDLPRKDGINTMKSKYDPTKEGSAYVMFNFGSFCSVGVTLHAGLSFEENLRLRSQDIESYRNKETGEWKTISVTYGKALNHLQLLIKARARAARNIDELAYEVNHWDYNDQFDSREEGLASVTEDLRFPVTIECIKGWLYELADEYSDDEGSDIPDRCYQIITDLCYLTNKDC